MKNINRRGFIKDTALAGIGLSVLNNPIRSIAAEQQNKVRVGIIGVGLRVSCTCRNAEAERRGSIAMADPDKEMMGRAQKLVKQFGKKAPIEFGNGHTITRTY
jgi:hypothetical protein